MAKFSPSKTARTPNMASRALPPPRNLDRAIEGSATLAGLLSGHRRSHQFFALASPKLPAAMRSLIRPGPIEDACWTLFAEHAAAAAKLRQLLPLLLECVAGRDPDVREIKVKILPAST
jgi:hypothetical protein